MRVEGVSSVFYKKRRSNNYIDLSFVDKNLNWKSTRITKSLLVGSKEKRKKKKKSK